MSERAVLLAGGRGTRLRPYTVVLPKPLMPIGEYPILEVMIRQLAACGFGRITIAVNHQANLIQAFFGDGRKWGVGIDYSVESTPLSTVGPLRLIDDLPETFLLANGDVLTDLRFDHLLAEHVSSAAQFTVAAFSRTHMVDYGVLEVDEAHQLVGFREKPSVRYSVSMGVYGVSKGILSLVPMNEPYGFDSLMRDLLAKGERVRIYPHDGYWADIGRPDDYMKAIDDFERLKQRLLPDG
jgi:NDP-sugar pyrophosphorylase family protein